MASKSPAHQFYPDKAKAGTIHLTPVAFKAYWMVLWWMWLEGKSHCQMPNTKTAWRRATMIDDQELLERVRAEIMHPECALLKCRKNGKVLLSFGLQKEAKKQAKRKRDAERAAKARWDKGVTEDKRQCEGNATASIPQCTPTPTPTPTPSPLKPKNKKPLKLSFGSGDLVKLTNEEYDQLVVDFGQGVISAKIEDLGNYIGSTGKRYKSHYHTIRTWIRKDEAKQTNKPQAQPSKYDGIGIG